SQFISSRTDLTSRAAHVVPGTPGTVISTTFTATTRETAFDNEFGVFFVDDVSGRIGNLHPGDNGYSAVALTTERKRVVFAAGKELATTSLDLPAGTFFGFYLIQRSTSADFVAHNPTDSLQSGPLAFFSFRAANPDRFEHVQEQPNNQFGFKVLFAGGDRDFNDLAVRIDFTSGTTPCDFDDNLTGWSVAENGGSADGHGTIVAENRDAVLREGDSFVVSLSRTFTVPDVPSSIEIMFDQLRFDTSSSGRAKDAFEAALLDSNRQTVVHTIDAGKDAFFNASEGQAPTSAVGTTLSNDDTITVSLAGLTAGSRANLVLRLVN